MCIDRGEFPHPLDSNYVFRSVFRLRAACAEEESLDMCTYMCAPFEPRLWCGRAAGGGGAQEDVYSSMDYRTDALLVLTMMGTTRSALMLKGASAHENSIISTFDTASAPKVYMTYPEISK